MGVKNYRKYYDTLLKRYLDGYPLTAMITIKIRREGVYEIESF
jgi:hypothetical protein